MNEKNRNINGVITPTEKANIYSNSLGFIKKNWIGFTLLASPYAIILVLEQVLPVSSMLFVVLKKGAIYALVAVSMNLCNGFTGLFSLGQAGFMLIGAY